MGHPFRLSLLKDEGHLSVFGHLTFSNVFFSPYKCHYMLKSTNFKIFLGLSVVPSQTRPYKNEMERVYNMPIFVLLKYLGLNFDH